MGKKRVIVTYFLLHQTIFMCRRRLVCQYIHTTGYRVQKVGGFCSPEEYVRGRQGSPFVDTGSRSHGRTLVVKWVLKPNLTEIKFLFILLWISTYGLLVHKPSISSSKASWKIRRRTLPGLDPNEGNPFSTSTREITYTVKVILTPV